VDGWYGLTVGPLQQGGEPVSGTKEKKKAENNWKGVAEHKGHSGWKRMKEEHTD